MPVPRGPEDVPLREYIRELKMVILVHDLNNDTIIRKETINYSENNARKWLGRITHWAISNGYSVETMSEKDYLDKVA